ncbi:hypothetical protein BD626DRAFT_398559 [Schizophyllum amplum]|uniref:DUF6534 domain-containing protein n=1 Tax=Schizophyllum amplum TaxID=97359 RepID=A0A550CLK7_9AGAR|nr:hypothetical protein BD626DRAFT_398559 [Auriculariopsis ampla]
MTPEEHHQAVFLLGPWLVGCYLEIFLQGVLMAQFTNYFNWYSDDKMSLRLVVIGLVVITLVKSVQSFALIWIQMIEYFTDLPGAILLNYTTWWQSGNPLMVACLGFYVQMYFVYRLWVISRSYFVIIPLLVIFTFSLLAIVVGTYYIAQAYSPPIAAWFAAHLSAVFAGDLCMTLTTAYFLIRSKANVLPQTVGMINALVRLTFSTAAPAAVCAMFNLIFSQLYDGQEVLISSAFNMILPKLYAISMMWTLNSRRSIRVAHSSGPFSGSGSEQLSGQRGTRGVVRTGRHQDHELTNIQVHTHVETVRAIDVNMFDGDESRSTDLKDTRSHDDKKSDYPV